MHKLPLNLLRELFGDSAIEHSYLFARLKETNRVSATVECYSHFSSRVKSRKGYSEVDQALPHYHP